MSDLNNSIQQKIDQALKLKKNLQAIEGKHAYTFRELFNNDFMQIHTSFNTISEFINASCLDFSSQESFQNIDATELDKFVSLHSQFSSWHEMKAEAGKLLLLNKIIS